MIPFTRRMTTAVTVFACLSAARTAWKLTTNGVWVSAVQAEHRKLFSIYRQLIHQDVANQELVLNRLICAAYRAIRRLNATVQEIPLTKHNELALSNVQLVVANAVQVMVNVASLPLGGDFPMYTQAVRASYSLTADDILAGFATVPIVWPVPFADTNYTCDFGVNNLDDLDGIGFAPGDIRAKTASGFNAVVNIIAAVPLIQSQLNALDVSTAQSASLAVPLSTMYMVTYYLAGHGTGSSDSSWNVEFTYTDATGLGQQTVSLGGIQGDQSGLLNDIPFTYPIFAVQGSTITLATTLASGSAFAYDFSVRIVQMPNNAVTPNTGDQIIVNAIGVHDPTGICGN